VTAGIDLALYCFAWCGEMSESWREYMATELGREEVRQMMEDGAQLIEVLPREEYEAEHLPKAINISLQRLDRHTTAALQQDQPVIVYCYDSQ
jgi:rhodanese-related sulfurtransferase